MCHLHLAIPLPGEAGLGRVEQDRHILVILSHYSAWHRRLLVSDNEFWHFGHGNDLHGLPYASLKHMSSAAVNNAATKAAPPEKTVFVPLWALTSGLLERYKQSRDYLPLLPSVSKNTAEYFSRHISNMVAELLAIFGKSGCWSKANESLNTACRSRTLAMGPTPVSKWEIKFSTFGGR